MVRELVEEGTDTGKINNKGATHTDIDIENIKRARYSIIYR